MRIVLQRASSARVVVEGRSVGELPRPGLVALVGITHDDNEQVAQALATKVWGLRILTDERSAADVGAPLLVISQFTLYANIRKGRRPSWSAAAPGTISEPLFNHFVAALGDLGAEVHTGIFGADMTVELVNDGPVTLLLDSDELLGPRRAQPLE